MKLSRGMNRVRNCRLLVVDWDYFCPPAPLQGLPCYGEFDPKSPFGRRGDPFFLEDVWSLRAGACLELGIPLPGTSGAEVRFWERFRFSPAATLYFGDSNSLVTDRRVHDRVGEVWLFDAHHDGGYTDDLTGILGGDRGLWMDEADCQTWMLAFWKSATLRMRYPKWRGSIDCEPEPVLSFDRAIDGGEPRPERFHRIFVCRSGGWAPPWCDPAFFRFLEACPVERRVNLDGLTSRGPEISEADCRAEYRTWRDFQQNGPLSSVADQVAAVLRARRPRKAVLA